MAATVQPVSRWYVTREAAKRFFMAVSTITDKDARIDMLIAMASRAIENYTGRRFIPWTGTKEYDFQGSDWLVLGDDLLSTAPTIKYNNVGTTVAAGDYFLYPLNAADDQKPYTQVQLLTTSDFFSYNDTPQADISVTGKWGYSEITRLMTTSNEVMDATETGFDLTSGTDIEIGMTLLVESEQMFVQNVATNTATVVRGVNGTTAATHVTATDVYAIYAPPDVQAACAALVARSLHRGDASWSDRIGMGESSLTFKSEMPAEVRALLIQYRRMVFVGVI